MNFQRIDTFLESPEDENFPSKGISKQVLGTIWDICLYGTSFSLSDLIPIIQYLRSIRESLPETGQEPLKEKLSKLEEIVTSFKEFHKVVEKVIRTTEGGSPGK